MTMNRTDVERAYQFLQKVAGNGSAEHDATPAVAAQSEFGKKMQEACEQNVPEGSAVQQNCNAGAPIKDPKVTGKLTTADESNKTIAATEEPVTKTAGLNPLIALGQRIKANIKPESITKTAAEQVREGLIKTAAEQYADGLDAGIAYGQNLQQEFLNHGLCKTAEEAADLLAAAMQADPSAVLPTEITDAIPQVPVGAEAAVEEGVEDGEQVLYDTLYSLITGSAKDKASVISAIEALEQLKQEGISEEEIAEKLLMLDSADPNLAKTASERDVAVARRVLEVAHACAARNA